MSASLEYNARKKSMVFAYLAWLVFGFIGAHHFYLGDSTGGKQMVILFVLCLIPIPVVVLLARVGLLVWWIIDAFMIPGRVERYNVALARSLMPIDREQYSVTE